MSDSHRKDLSTKAQEKMTPDSSKSTLERTKESLTDTADHAAAGMQTDNSKSGTQSAFDHARREKDSTTGNGGNLLDKTKNALGLGN